MRQLMVQEAPIIGAALIDPIIEKDRGNVLMMMNAAYATILSDNQANFGLWEVIRRHVTPLLQRRYQSLGLIAPPWNLDALWARVNLPVPSKDPISHVELVRALMTNYQERFAEHIRYRLNTGGNIHLEFSGPTGMGKSSCAVALANWISTIPPDQLHSHLSFDLGDLPSKLRDKRPGQTVIQDEYLQTSGEGARTFQGLFQNLEDTLRASQVNLFVISPRQQEHATMQARLELILWHPGRQYSVFLVWLEGRPHGVVALPWMPKELYASYGTWKANNVQRSLSGQFKDNTYLVRTAMRAFADERFVSYLVDAANKPKLKDFNTALEFFHPQMMAGSQADRVVGFMYNVCYNFDRLESKFKEWFGLEPSDGFRKVAKKCYEE